MCVYIVQKDLMMDRKVDTAGYNSCPSKEKGYNGKIEQHIGFSFMWTCPFLDSHLLLNLLLDFACFKLSDG